MRRWPRPFREANQRRIELIQSRYRLTVDEKAELKLLEGMTTAWASYRWPIQFPSELAKYRERREKEIQKSGEKGGGN